MNHVDLDLWLNVDILLFILRNTDHNTFLDSIWLETESRSQTVKELSPGTIAKVAYRSLRFICVNIIFSVPMNKAMRGPRFLTAHVKHDIHQCKLPAANC